MKIALIVIVTLILLVIVMQFYGARLPREHVAEVTRLVPLPPARVAALVRDVEAQTTWRPSVKRIEVLERAPALRYREVGKNGEITFVFTEVETDRAFESRIDDEALPFGGRWLFKLAAEGEGTRVTIREEGFIKPAIFRVLALHVFGHDSTMKNYLAELEAAASRGG